MQLQILEDSKPRKVIKSNALIEAKYVFSLMEIRTFAFLVTLIQRGDEPNKRYSLEIKDLAKILYDEGKRSGKLYEEIRRVIKRLRDKSFWIKEGNEDNLVSWIKDPKINNKSGTVTFEFYPELRPHLFDLKSRFTQYSLMYIANMKSKYSARLYEALKQYESLKKREFDLDRLREFLGLREYDGKKKIIKDAMKRYPDLRRNVLDVAVKEISNKTDLFVSYTAIKSGNKVIKIIFRIEKNEDNIKKESPSSEIISSKNTNSNFLLKITKILKEYFDINEERAKSFISQVTKQIPNTLKVNLEREGITMEDYFSSKIEYCKWRNAKNKIDNIPGFLKKSILENYDVSDFNREKEKKEDARLKRELKNKIDRLDNQLQILNKNQMETSLKYLENWIPKNTEKNLEILNQLKKSSSFVAQKIAKSSDSTLELIKSSSMVRALYIVEFDKQKLGEEKYLESVEKSNKSIEELNKEIQLLKSV